MLLRNILFAICLLGLALSCGAVTGGVRSRPNVLLIMCDDLNDYEGIFGGHPQASTPNIDRLADASVIFSNAYSNAPVCAPIRSAMLTGIYPHVSGNYGFSKWYRNPVLKNSKTLMRYFRENGYDAFGTGKLMHHTVTGEWSQFGVKRYAGPLASDGKGPVPHPSVPKAFGQIGPLDGTFASLADIPSVPASEDAPGYTGWWDFQRKKPFRYVSDEDRDPMRDEEIAAWAVKRIRQLEEEGTGKPFLLGVGFSRPHTALVAPQKYFDMFPREDLQLPVTREDDASDCCLKGNIPDASKGFRHFEAMKGSYSDFRTGLRCYLQAYLACVAFADEQVGKVLDALKRSSFNDNTVVVFTSDHGYDFGQKEYFFKNSLWEDSTRVPLLIRVPGMSRNAGKECLHPVSLIDIYPTLADLCGLNGDTRKNEQGAHLSGHSMRPFIVDPGAGDWAGPGVALTVVSSKNGNQVSDQNYAIRSRQWRYILYQDGREELYDHLDDPHEWVNLAENPEFGSARESMRDELFKLVPQLEGRTLNGPVRSGGSRRKSSENTQWYRDYLEKYPESDTDGDGIIAWPEVKKHKEKLGE